MYAKTNEWVENYGENIVEIGISDAAQSDLGDVVYVELPELGVKFDQDQKFGSVESTKAASDVFTPVSGTVVEVNKRLSAEPALINKSPLDEGWIIRLKVDSNTNLDNLGLMTEDEYKTSVYNQTAHE